MNLEELKNKQIEQMTRKDCLPVDETEIILHLVEKVGEVCEAKREKHTKERYENEIADVLWQLNKLCWINNINLEDAFKRKLERNEKR